MLSRFSYCYFMLLFSLWCQWWGGTLYGLRKIFSLLNTCCWRTKHKILIHDGESWCELINLYTVCPTTRFRVFFFCFLLFFFSVFVIFSAIFHRQGKTILLFTLYGMTMQGYCDVYIGALLRLMSPEVKC